MKHLILPLALMAQPAFAEEATYPEGHLAAITCTENLVSSTTWEQCLGLIFQDCAGLDVGSPEQLACLDTSRKSWSTTAENLQDEMNEAITPEGALEFTRILGQWTGFVIQKCQTVADSKPESGKEAARLGCEITEIVGLSGEVSACLEGRSTAEYCRRP